MLPLHRLIRRRPECNSVATHKFLYMIDEYVHFWCHLEIVCLRFFHERFLKYVYMYVFVMSTFWA